MNFNPTKKDWLKFIKTITNPYFLEAIIVEAEGRKAKLNPEFKSRTPGG